MQSFITLFTQLRVSQVSKYRHEDPSTWCYKKETLTIQGFAPGKIRSRRWKLLPITFLTCDTLHKPEQCISEFLRSDLCHFRYYFNTCPSSLSRFTGLDVRKTSRELWVQTQRWHTTLMRSNFHPKAAAFLSSVRTLAQKSGDFMGEPWTKDGVTVCMLNTKRSEDAHDNFTRIKSVNHFFEYFFASGASMLSFKIVSVKGASLPPFPPGFVLPCKPQEEHELWDLPCSPEALTPHLQQLYLLSHPPVILQESQVGVWRVYRELECLGEKIATEKVCFAQCQRGCLERAKKSSWGVWGEKKLKKSRQLLVSQFSMTSARPELSIRRKAQNAPLHLCNTVNTLLETPPAPQREGHTRPPTLMSGLKDKCFELP